MESLQSTVHSMDTDISEKFVVAACGDSIVRLFALRNLDLELLSELSGHTGAVTKALFANQGELIVSSDFNGRLIIWKLEGSSFVKKLEMQVTEGPIYDIAVRYKDSGMTVFCGCDGGILRTVAYDTALKETVTEKEVHRYSVISVSCNEDYVATGGLDCSVALISEDGIEYLRHHRGAVNAVALSPSHAQDRVVLATCSEDGRLCFVEKNGEDIQQQEINIGEPCYSLDWSKSGFTLTVGYGKEGFKSFIRGEDGSYEEVPMEKVEK